MSEHGKAIIERISTGIADLDNILGGGLPDYSFNMIAGDPGAGKTTLCHQIMFANASPEKPAIYFTILGESPLKMLRYQQQFTFFDMAKVDQSIHFINLSEQVMENLAGILKTITDEVERLQPGVIVIDSFRSLARRSSAGQATGSLAFQTFLERLAIHLTSWQATSFLVGEYTANDARENPIFTLADGILWLSQTVNRNSMVRKLQVLKMRGQNTQPGMHSFRISNAGLQIFPRLVKPIEKEVQLSEPSFISTGIAGLDEMLGGGTFRGSALLVGGPSGSGKSTVAIQFLTEGVKQGEPGVLAVFEETPIKYLEQAKSIGIDLEEMCKQDQIRLIYMRPLDLSVDETLYQIQKAVGDVKAKRVVIDSLTGLEIALAPTFEQDFRESLYRLIGALTVEGINILMTVEVTELFTELRFSPHAVSFMTNDIILQRYIELEGRLRTVMTIVKARSRKHSDELRLYEITKTGMVVGDALPEYEGIITGLPRLRGNK